MGCSNKKRVKAKSKNIWTTFGPLKSKKEQKYLIIEKLKNIDNTDKLIYYISNNFVYSAITECDKLNLNDHMKNKIGRLKWQTA